MNAKRLLGMTALAFGLIAAVLVASLEHASSEGAEPERRAPISRDPGADARTASGVQPRRHDPAQPPLEWTSGEAEYEAAATETVAYQELLKSFWGTGDASIGRELLPFYRWSIPWGQEGDAGEKISRCATRYEAKLQDRCMWNNVLVAVRTSEHQGQIRFARCDLLRGENDPSCVGLASCISSAWVQSGEPVPMPSALGDVLSLVLPGRGAMWHAGMAQTHEHWYESLVEDSRTQLRAAERSSSEVDAMTEFQRLAYEQNRLFNRMRLREAERMLGLLRGP